MLNQYADSDVSVKRRASVGIRILTGPRVTTRNVSATSKEPEPVTEYVIKLLSEWEGSGKKLKDLDTGMSPSMPSQIKARTSTVTNYSGPRFAKVFGMTYPELVSRAYEWYATERSANDAATAPAIDPHPGRASAIDMAMTLGASAEDLAPVLLKYSGDAFQSETAAWWIQTFLNEGVVDAKKAARKADKLEKKAAVRAASKKRVHREQVAEKRQALATVAKNAKRRPNKDVG